MEAWIVGARRSPLGRAFKGSLTGVRADDLVARVIQATLDATEGVSLEDVEDLYLGCALPHGEQGQNLARVVSVLMGAEDLPGTTINRYCSSSVQTTRMAYHAIRSGEGNVFLSAGVESVSRGPNFRAAGVDTEGWNNPAFNDAAARSRAIAAGEQEWTDPRAEGLLPDVYIAMGQTAENVATHCGISRTEQDEWAAESQRRAVAAIEAGLFDEQIVPIELPDGTVVTRDDGPRPGTTVEKLATLQPVFRENGTVTAGNSCPLNDGAASLLITSDEFAKSRGIKPLARVVSTAVSALSPEIMGLGPIEATRRALELAGLTIGDIDLYEINEAFAAQVLPSARELGMDLERLNVHGGGIALGHPFGATGARITGTLLGAMQERDAQFGLETMCVGGGQGMAMIIERL